MVSMGSPAGPCVPGGRTALCLLLDVCVDQTLLLLLLQGNAPGDTDRPPSPELGVLQAHIPAMEHQPRDCPGLRGAE